MATFLQHGLRLARAHRRRAFTSPSTQLSTDALVEVKPSERSASSPVFPKTTSVDGDGFVVMLEFGEIGVLVIIYSPARSATQQDSGKVGQWKINFLSTHKWENPLMGWTSTAEPYANVGEAGLSFNSEEAAKAFAEKHGWEYTVKKPHRPVLKPKSYADNFKWKGPPKPEA